MTEPNVQNANWEAPGLPSWLQKSERYEPVYDRDGFILKSLLSVARVLRQLRLDGNSSSPFAPSATFKILSCLLLLLLNSLSGNFAFTLLLLALALARVSLLPLDSLKRALSVSVFATFFAFVLMLPALLLGQPHSAVLVAGKTFVSSLLVMVFALTTPFGEISHSLRALHVPAFFVLSFELALKGIYALGTVCDEVLLALSLRSVGKNNDKSASLGAVGGVVFIKARDYSEATYEAMVCRGFDGEYKAVAGRRVYAADIAWFFVLVILFVAFFYFQGQL